MNGYTIEDRPPEQVQRDEAVDALQVALLRWRRLPDSFETQLVRMALSRCVEYVRAQSRQAEGWEWFDAEQPPWEREVSANG